VEVSQNLGVRPAGTSSRHSIAAAWQGRCIVPR
jgi:hypothetical protein